MGKEIVVGVSGASGALYAARLLQALEGLEAVAATHLVVSRGARMTIEAELGLPAVGPLDLKRMLGFEPARLRLHDDLDLGACISSGSHRHAGMVVAPCSMGTLGRIAQGISDSLLTRAADVSLKERRPLILLVRESPLSRVHLRNMLAAAEAGATILPASPGFYLRPRSVDELVDQVLARVLDHLGLEHRIGARWAAPPPTE